jgi:hypothetical protein
VCFSHLNTTIEKGNRVDHLKLHVEGHVLITDVDTGEVIMNRRNAIHRENMSAAIAGTMTNTTYSNGLAGFIQSMVFGNDGVSIDIGGNITYNTPNVTDVTAELHNQTFSKLVNFTSDDDPANNTTVVHSGGTTFSDIVITSTLDYGEPIGQQALDNTADLEGDFVFDEIGLVSQQGRLLTHLIFHPVQKSANRKIQIVYTVRISVG